MDTTELRAVLKRAASLLRATGANKQAQSVEAVGTVVAASGDHTVEEFVEKTKAALSEPPLGSLSVDEIIERLAGVGSDPAKFGALFKQMQARDFSKDKAFATAARFTGSKATAWKSKPKALQAIKSKFDERMYAKAKDAENSQVTPW